MVAVWLWARADLRRRWRSIVVLAVLLGLAGGFALTALVGARRAATGWDRFRDETLAPDAFVSIPSRTDPAVNDEMRSLPGVVDVAPFVYVGVAPPGGEEGGAFAAVDDRLGRTITRWRVVEGRRADPDRPDEVVVNSAMVEAAGLRAGDRVTLSDPEGTFSLEVRVVGVVVGSLDLSQNAASPSAYLTRAFLAEYSDQVDVGRQNQFVRLARGVAGVPDFTKAVASRYGDQGGVMVGSSDEEDVTVRQALGLQAWALALLAGAAAGATLVALGQALARHIMAGAADGGALEAMGMTRAQRAAGALPAVAIVVLAGTACAVVATLVASPLVPTGLAGQVEPRRGMTTDLVALGGGGAVLAGLLAAAGGAAAWRAGRARAHGAASSPTAMLPIPLGPTATVGLTNALGGARPRARAAARSAVAAAILGAVGVATAITFACSLDHLVTTPRLFGWDFDAVLGVGGEDAARADAAAESLIGDPAVTRLAVADVVFITMGEENVEAIVLDPRKGKRIHPAIVAGRPAEGFGEIVLGAENMERLGADLGSRVEAVGADGPVELTVVGRAVFPIFGDARIDDAASLSPATAAGLRQEESRGRFVLVSVAPGADPVSVAAHHTDLFAGRPLPPSEVTNLKLVRSAPWVLAAFLAVLALAAVGHALVLSVRSGRRDLAVLRTLGFVRGQVRGTVIWQASAIVGVGLLVGLPLGVAAGRWLWTTVATRTGAVVDPVTAAGLLVAIVPVALIAANLVAAIPGQAAARVRPALALRAE